MSTINVKITETGWLLTKGDKTISIKDNGDGKLGNGDELSSELSGSGFTQQDIKLVANTLNNPQQAQTQTKGNFWGNFGGFMSGLFGGMSSLFNLGGLFGFGGQDSWAFNGCGGVGFNDMRVWNYGLNSMWSGDIGYTGSSQGAYDVLGNLFGGSLGTLSGLQSDDDGLNLKVTPKTETEVETDDGNGNGNGNGNISGAGNEAKTGSGNGAGNGNGDGNGSGSGTGDGNGSGTGLGDGNGNGTGNLNGNGDGNSTGDGNGNGNGNGNGDGNGNGTGAGGKKTGPRFYTGDESDIDKINGSGNGNGGKKRSITD